MDVSTFTNCYKTTSTGQKKIFLALFYLGWSVVHSAPSFHHHWLVCCAQCSFVPSSLAGLLCTVLPRSIIIGWSVVHSAPSFHHHWARLLCTVILLRTPCCVHADSLTTPCCVHADSLTTPCCVDADSFTTPCCVDADSFTTPCCVDADSLTTPARTCDKFHTLLNGQILATHRRTRSGNHHETNKQTKRKKKIFF